MQFADSQVSRTQNTFATDTPKSVLSPASTWTNNHPKQSFSADEAEKLVYKSIVLDHEIAPRLKTERGLDAMTRKIFGIDSDADDDTASAALMSALCRADEAQKAVVAGAETDMPARPGRSLRLPSTGGDYAPWRGNCHWFDNALEAVRKCTNRKLRRVARQHWPFILRALAFHADRATGRNCYASNLTIGKTAARLFREHVDAGGSWERQRTDELADRTLADAVSIIVSVLIELGYLVERARGRHLTRRERIIAKVRHGIHQTKAASVRDLILPPDKRTPEPDPPATPSWCTPLNPFVAARKRDQARTTLVLAISSPLLRTHRHVVTLSGLLKVFSGYLTHARDAQPQKPSRSPGTITPRPSLPAKKTAADFLRFAPWALRNPDCPTQPHHINALGSVLDDVGAAGMRGRVLYELLNEEFRRCHLEICIPDIRRPLAWLRVLLTRVLPVTGV